MRRMFMVVVAVLLGIVSPAWADEPESAQRPYNDTGRFYFYFEGGNAWILDDHMVDDLEFTNPNPGANVVIGGGAGYNITDHWGVELQAHGTEPDVHSEGRDRKIEEYSNITIVPAVRFRYPIGNGQIVPYLTAGIGYSMNDDNDTGDPRIKIKADDSTIAGSVAAGLDYFLSSNVAIGVSLHSFIYPDQEAHLIERDRFNRITLDTKRDFNQTTIALLAHLKLFPGEPGQGDQRGLMDLLIAKNGPFDTDELRGYFIGVGGHTQMFSDEFGGGIELKAPGDFNATLGGGMGVNFDRNWGAEILLTNTDPNVNLRPLGKFAEFSNFTVMPQARFRWPFLGGRLVPYATAGVGVAFYNINDKRGTVDIPTERGNAVTTHTPTIKTDETTVAASAGVGVEYFLNHHVSFGVALPFYIYPDVNTKSQKGRGPVQYGHANFSGLAGLITIKAYFE
jgi:opacity protein-like surface antigen